MSTAVRLTLTQRCCLRSSDVTRANAVALDIVASVLRADVARQHLQATFGGSVGADGLTTELTHHRADVDYLTFAAFHHLRQHCCADDVRCYQVNVNNLLEILPLHLMHRNTLDDTGVVDEDVNLPYLGMNFLHESLHGHFVRHVADITMYIADTRCLIICQRFVDSFLTAGIEDNLTGTGLSKCFGYSKTDAVACACDPGILAFQ